MPKTVALVALQSALADATDETMVTVLEARRYAHRFAKTRQEIRNLPGRELGIDRLRDLTHELRAFANGPASPTAIAHDALALLTEARSRTQRARRSWGLMYGIPGDGLVALDRCPLTGASCFGIAFIRLLSDERLFSAANVLSVSGNRGLVLLKFHDGRDAKFRIGLPPGPDFDGAQAIARWRTIEVQRLRPLFNLLRNNAEGRP